MAASTVYTNTCAFFTPDNTALIPTPSTSHTVGGTVGGGFGGKGRHVEPIATLAAMKTGRPVKFKFTREEEMRVSSTRSGWRMYFKDGVMRDGRIVARQVTTYADAGAYNRHTPYAVTKHAANVAGPYAIPTCRLRHAFIPIGSGYDAGFGVTSGSFGWVQMDRMPKLWAWTRGRFGCSTPIAMATRGLTARPSKTRPWSRSSRPRPR
jgi:xanthine dehydrogenase molybdopterin-binding subunit B